MSHGKFKENDKSDWKKFRSMNRYIAKNGDESEEIKLNRKFNGLIEGPLSGSSHDRVVNSLVETFKNDIGARYDAYDRIISTGRLALPTLYAIILDDEIATYIAGKSLGLKRKEIDSKLNDPDIKKRIEDRKVVLKANSVTFISKIVAKLDFEEKNKAVNVFQHALIREKDQNVIHAILLSVERMGDAALTLLPLINNFAKDQNSSLRVRTQAISLVSKIIELNKSSANALLDILSNSSEKKEIRENAILSLTEYAHFLSIDNVQQLVNIFIHEIESDSDKFNINGYINLLSACGSKVLNFMLPVITDRSKKRLTRESACYVCFGVAKKDYNLEGYILGSFADIIEKLKAEQQNGETNIDDQEILQLLIDLAKKLSY